MYSVIFSLALVVVLVVRVLVLAPLEQRFHAGTRFREVFFVANNVQQNDLAVDGFAHDKGVFNGDFADRREIKWNEDAVVRHVFAVCSEGTSTSGFFP